MSRNNEAVSIFTRPTTHSVALIKDKTPQTTFYSSTLKIYTSTVV